MPESDQVAGRCSVEGYQGGTLSIGHKGADTGLGPEIEAPFHPYPAKDGSDGSQDLRNSLRVNTLGQGQ